jgi:hypothetical protein
MASLSASLSALIKDACIHNGKELYDFSSMGIKSMAIDTLILESAGITKCPFQIGGTLIAPLDKY